MENAGNRALPKDAQGKKEVVAKLPIPVHPKTGKQIRIINVNCEFCGISAARCQHAQAFRDNGLLQRSAAIHDEEKIYQNFPGLPRVIAKICEFCGVDAKICAHGAERKERAKMAPPQARERVERDPVTGATIYIKEPESKEVTETTMKSSAVNSKIIANRAKQEANSKKPTPTDKEVSASLDKAMQSGKGIGSADDEVDV